ncbi:MAG TPA: serine/threonine-protein kinase [Micromonosporaceae bacterium]|jgi:hypothetical protein|nr:serine/threonine-protein kinase [Micromonosporaceae bacterium]
MVGWRELVAGRYRLAEPLGVGGMGRVWLARDEVLRRDVAVKEIMLPEGRSPDEREELRVRTLREARTAARLNHPNVVQIYDVVHTEEQPWIVMEYVRARSLQEVLREDGPLSPKRAAEIGLAMLAALGTAHEHGVVHRDVKPANVLLADDGRVVLTDFGLAVFDSGEGAVTRPGLILGSPQYVAPERAREGVSSPEADLWSLGATLYAAVEGHAPYARSTAMATLTALATQAFEPPLHAGPLKPVLDGLLRKNPRTRMPAGEAEVLLRRVVAGDARPRKRLVPRQRQPTAVPAVAGGTQTRTVVLHRLRRRDLVVAGVVVVVLLVPGYALVREISGAPGATLHPAAVGGPVTASAGPSASAGPASVLGFRGCSGPEAAQQPAASARAHSLALPAGWTWYDDPSGFSIAVPAGWSFAKSGSLACFRSPHGERVLAVDAWRQADGNLKKYWGGVERALLDGGKLPGYVRLGLADRDYFLACADWEYSFDGADGIRRHAIARGFISSPGQAYAIYWLTPEFDWTVNLTNLDVVTPSFAPARR